ncbi:uncharacterized protein PHALS_05268 [Plasmopara halstedii]|uniref:Uncharacterized protein n=1 Tax=Plasmopara halstedii TaxID=4781 RepID=A0A0P1B172_PLAHL|nr:uncharacterized protein PHALS_05268 [Plasmopara halstedii]CEG47945.1 hypothetical protein PHALS_05268 [Plasmopara halstedii]|eukprot:XP_024584314.1 hypothetical protein PHALS_05268 [Plasmopara halstedii]
MSVVYKLNVISGRDIEMLQTRPFQGHKLYLLRIFSCTIVLMYWQNSMLFKSALPIAQLVERAAVNLKVTGSCPSG